MHSLSVELCPGQLAQAPYTAVITGHKRRGFSRGCKAQPRAACMKPRIRVVRGSQTDL